MRKYIIYIIMSVTAALTCVYGAERLIRPEAATSEIDCIINDCNLLSGEIAVLEARMAQVESVIDLLDCDLASYDDSLRLLTDSIRVMGEEVSQLLVQARKNRYRLSEADALFSSQPVAQVIRRAGYIDQQISDAGYRLKALHNGYFDLRQQRDRIADAHADEDRLYASLDNINDELWDKRDRLDELRSFVTDDEDVFIKAMDLRYMRADTLNRRVAYLMASDKQKPKKKTSKSSAPAPKKPSAASSTKNNAKSDDSKTVDTDKALEKVDPETAAFIEKKGGLPSPVDASYVVVQGYGTHSDPDYPKVKISNPGVDLEVEKGAKALAVADGKVSAVFSSGGYHYVVMVRHGDYFTVYGGIDKLSVNTGDSVKAGQALGALHSDASDKNRTILHFEVRNDTRSFNPIEWLKR